MASDLYPLYPTAVVLPILAFPSWILCIPPMVWHFSQRNIAAGSLILWMSLLNLFNSINPLIWPRDNVQDWWDGNVLCDIEARIQVGAVVSLTSCTAFIARRLSNVMDTRNITVSASTSSKMKEKILEVVWCWGYPAVMMVIYYVVQPARYFIFGISGCVAAYDASWPSIVLIWMWGPITTFVAAYFAGLLFFRLYRYRREFHRLIAAHNSTKSRFVRLFIMAVVFVVVFIPYNLFILYQLASSITDNYSWDVVHGPTWNAIIKVPVQGTVRFDRWAEVATGYFFFLVFGTSTDAHNIYKRMLCFIGLGKIFPSLYIMKESGKSTPSSVTFAKGWLSSWSSKAKTLFSKNGSVTETQQDNTRNASVLLGATTPNHSGHLQPISTNEPILPQHSQDAGAASNSRAFFRRIFGRRGNQSPVLPLSNNGSLNQLSAVKKSAVDTLPSGVHARAWATDNAPANQAVDDDHVYVIQEIHQAHADKGKEKETDPSAWV